MYSSEQIQSALSDYINLYNDTVNQLKNSITEVQGEPSKLHGYRQSFNRMYSLHRVKWGYDDNLPMRLSTSIDDSTPNIDIEYTWLSDSGAVRIYERDVNRMVQSYEKRISILQSWINKCQLTVNGYDVELIIDSLERLRLSIQSELEDRLSKMELIILKIADKLDVEVD